MYGEGMTICSLSSQHSTRFPHLTHNHISMISVHTFPPKYLILSSLKFSSIDSNPSLGATYDSIEGRFRIIKNEANKLKKEIESGSRPEAPPRGSSNPDNETSTTPARKPSTPGRKPGTPRKGSEGGRVLNGRVGKGGSPSKTSKKATDSLVKSIKEEFADNGSGFILEDVDAEGEENIGWGNGVDLGDTFAEIGNVFDAKMDFI